MEVDLARVGDGVENGVFGDFVEDDAACRLGFESEHFKQVPCDGFSLAILIGCEPHGFGFGGGAFEFAHKRFLVFGDLVQRFEAVVFVDAEVFFAEVAYVAVA